MREPIENGLTIPEPQILPPSSSLLQIPPRFLPLVARLPFVGPKLREMQRLHREYQIEVDATRLLKQAVGRALSNFVQHGYVVTHRFEDDEGNPDGYNKHYYCHYETSDCGLVRTQLLLVFRTSGLDLISLAIGDEEEKEREGILADRLSSYIELLKLKDRDTEILTFGGISFIQLFNANLMSFRGLDGEDRINYLVRFLNSSPNQSRIQEKFDLSQKKHPNSVVRWVRDEPTAL